MMKQRIRDRGKRLAKRMAPTVTVSISDALRLGGEVRSLRRRVAELESEVQETRRLHRRVAEITDVMEEVLIPAANRDDRRLREALEKYSQAL